MMKIVFLCGSLEPGRDGVGDYTRRLAGELIRLGHKVGIVALRDHQLSKEFTGLQVSDGQNLSVLRMPLGMNYDRRTKIVKEWIGTFDPEWLSLQYVPYAFHSKGLHFFLGSELNKFLKGRRMHIMFHENWVGQDIDTGWKRLLTGYLQKRLVTRLLTSLRPAVIHTNVPANWSKLQKLGWKAKKLLLFSNISPEKQVEIEKQGKNANDIFRIGFFSQVETSEAVLKFLTCLGEQVIQHNMKPEILLIGGESSRMHIFGNTLEKLKDFKNAVKYTGFQQPKDLSFAIQSCALGITPIPRHALGKSGSVAAFLEHGIPVAAPNTHCRYDPKEIGFFSSGLCSTIILEPDINLLHNAKQAAISAKNEINLSTIAKRFLDDLEFSG